MVYLTINQVIKQFSDIQAAHPMLRSFGYGQVDKLEQFLAQPNEPSGESEPDKMPFMWLNPINTTGGKGLLNYNIELLIGDLVRDAEENETDVESDAHSICVDVLATLHNYLEQQADSKLFMINFSFSTQPFYENLESSYTGQLLNLTISTKFDFDYCEVPK